MGCASTHTRDHGRGFRWPEMVALPAAQASSNVLIDLDQEIQLAGIRFEQDPHTLIDDEAAQAKHVGTHILRHR